MARAMIKCVCVLCLFVFLGAVPGNAQEGLSASPTASVNGTAADETGTEKFGLGLGYPFLSARYRFIPEITAEARFAMGEGIKVMAGRLYWNFFSPTGSIRFFTGAEYGMVSFDNQDITGNGSEAGVLLGGEYFITKQCSFLLDMTPTWISLSSDSKSVDSLEWVTNLALYFYLF